jgi:hypothetical protein
VLYIIKVGTIVKESHLLVFVYWAGHILFSPPLRDIVTEADESFERMGVKITDAVF